MTGKYAANVGLHTALIPGNPAGLDPKYTILPESLSKLGYKNYLVGKWHLGQSKKKYHPLNRGFNEFYGLLGGGFNHFTKQQGLGRFDFWNGFEPEWDNKTHSTDLLNAKAIKLVQSHAENPDSDPYFLYLAYPAVHDPLQAPERHQKLCSHIKNSRRRLSCAMVAGVDEGIGSIIKILEDNNKLEDTIIIFSIDNGGVPYAGALNYPLRGAKATLFEGGVRSPGFIHAPNIFKEKSYDFKELFHISDYFPTLLSMIESDSSQISNITTSENNFDGVDQFSALKQLNPSPRKSIHIHRDWDRDGHAYRRGPWKIIVGHHFLPFFFSEVYNETNNWWLVENGHWRDKTLQIVQDAIDYLLGRENIIFVQYFLWTAFDSYNVGGIQKTQNANQDSSTKEILQNLYKSDLKMYRKIQDEDPRYPVVSLFNLENDPQETRNLAKDYPELVEELLKEAEIAIENAPKPWRTDMIHVDAPVSAQHNLLASLRTLGTNYEETIPFGVYLDDDVNLDELEYERLLSGYTMKVNLAVISLKIIAAFILLPTILIVSLLKSKN